jgi:hypothetical protein
MVSKQFPIQVGSPDRLSNPVAVDAIYKKSPSPYSGQEGGFLSVGPKQPLIWRQPGYNSALQSVQNYTGRGLPIASAVTDVQRLTKFLQTGTGILFLGKQFLLQQQNAFNETNLYNPASPIVAAAAPSTAGIVVRPKRHVDTSGGLLRALGSSLGLDNFIGEGGPNHVDGTAAAEKLPTEAKTGTKGLIRAKTGNAARKIILTKYGSAAENGKGGFLSNLGSQLLKTFLPAVGGNPDQFSGLTDKYRADEDLYAKMRGSKRLFGDLYPYISPTSVRVDTNRINDGKIMSMALGGYQKTFVESDQSGNLSKKVDGDTYPKPPITYYNDPKLSTPRSQGTDDQGGSVFEVPVRPVPGASAVYKKYSNLISKKSNVGNRGAGREVDGGYSKQVENSTDADRALKNVGFRTGVSSADGTVDSTGKIVVSELIESQVGPIKNFENVSTKQEQIIAFWFKDVANGIYLPFNTTIKGISDNHTIDWEEVQYLGRPDKVYNYKGFTRDVSFTFTAYCMSVKDLEPMWKKINYLLGMARPANYHGEGFFVPPLVELRMGDMYYNQPVIMRTISITIPDDASWELIPANQGGVPYQYGIGQQIVIDGAKYAQVPTRVDVSVNLSVLEKETPKTGVPLFGSRDFSGNFNFST